MNHIAYSMTLMWMNLQTIFLKKAFMVEKYGEKPPFMMKKEEPTVEVGEKQEEKPVEVVEIVNEVPEEPVVEEKVTEINEDQEANEFKLVEKKVKKPRKRKLA